eukprot:3645876-Pyramimonas_sp.AAC.1
MPGKPRDSPFQTMGFHPSKIWRLGPCEKSGSILPEFRGASSCGGEGAKVAQGEIKTKYPLIIIPKPPPPSGRALCAACALCALRAALCAALTARRC